MSLVINNFSLSALTPIKMCYGFNNQREDLQADFKIFNNELSYIKHKALSGYKDAAFSKGNLIALTDVIRLDQILDTPSKVSKQFIGQELNNSNFKLRNIDGLLFKKFKNRIYTGGVGEDITFNLISITPNVYEIKLNNSLYMEVSQVYPYDIYFIENTEGVDPMKRYFEIDFWENKMTIKASTPEGHRYISSNNIDNVVRANGLYLNNTVASPYILTPEFISANNSLVEINERMNPVEVFYTNEITGEVEHQNLSIKQKQQNETNTLITFSLEESLKEEKTKANIALLKSNFTAAGFYTTK